MDFARWIQFSGLIKLFKDNPQSEPLKVDGELIDKLVRDLIMDCGDWRNWPAKDLRLVLDQSETTDTGTFWEGQSNCPF
jgi:hypothetical protein